MVIFTKYYENKYIYKDFEIYIFNSFITYKLGVIFYGEYGNL